MAEVFPADDPLSEWLVTLALAMNDLALVHDHLDRDDGQPDRMFYWQRLALSHFTEAALFLSRTSQLPEVAAFIESLDEPVRAMHAECLAVFNAHRIRLFTTRNVVAFHYPELRSLDPQAPRPMRDALHRLAEERGVFRTGTVREARALFADEAIAAVFANEVAEVDTDAPVFLAAVSTGVTAFVRFANLALDEHLVRANQRGVVFTNVELVDPDNPSRGWRDVRHLPPR
jgi:hypothetical protein